MQNTTGWIEPKFPKEYRFKRYKVIRIYHTFARSKREAVNLVADGKVELEAEFAAEEQPKGWKGNLLKQLFG